MMNKRIEGIVHLKDIKTGKEYKIPGKYLRPCQPLFDLVNEVEKDPDLQKEQYQVEICNHYPQNECRFDHKCNKMHICGTFFQQEIENTEEDNNSDCHINCKKPFSFKSEKKRKLISIVNHFSFGEEHNNKFSKFHTKFCNRFGQENNHHRIIKEFNKSSFIPYKKKFQSKFDFSSKRHNNNKYGDIDENNSEKEDLVEIMDVFHTETGRVMHVPINAIQYTKGIKNGQDRKNCMYYLEGECKYGNQCLDIHVHRDFMKFYLDHQLITNKRKIIPKHNNMRYIQQSKGSFFRSNRFSPY